MSRPIQVIIIYNLQFMFREMQACFKAHPEIYGEELEDEEDQEKGETIVADTESTESTPISPNTQTPIASESLI